MRVFGRYFAYRLKNSALRTVIFTLLALAITMTVVPTGLIGFYPEYHDTSLYMHAILLGIFCTLIPILETSAFKNRRNLDTLYFFPINRWKMALAHYLSGFIQVIAIYSVPFFTAWIYLEAQTNYFKLGYMLPYYFLSLLVGLVMYSLFMFIFGQGNTVADGVLFCVLWIFVLYCVSYAFRQEFLGNLINTKYWDISGNIMDWGIIYAPINNLTVIFQDLIEVNQHVNEYNYTSEMAQIYRETWYMFVLWAALGIDSLLGYFVTFITKGAEKAGEISNSWFGYKVLIPAYGYSLILMVDVIDYMSVFIFALMVIGYIIYRRGFKFKLSDYIVMGCGLIPMLLVAIR